MSPPKTSRNKRTSERGNFNAEDVSRAIKSVMFENESVRAAAGRYNVPRSTLTRYIEKVSNKYSDLSTVSDKNLQETIQQVGSYAACAVKQVFSAEQEKALVSYAKKCSDHYYGLNITELRELAYQFAKKIQIPYPFKWDEDKMSGRDWYYGFMRRHQELSLRTPEQTTLHRVKSFSKENVQVFFRNLDAVLAEYPYQAAEIWNMDETGFSTVPTKIGKIIAVRGMRRVGQISAQERGSMITMALAVNAEGNFIPPLREKQEKRDASKMPKKRPISSTRKADTKTPAKRGRPPKKTLKQPSSDDDADRDFCIICLELMPLKLNRNNSIACIECKRDVHLKCAKLTKSYFICQNCDSD